MMSLTDRLNAVSAFALAVAVVMFVLRLANPALPSMQADEFGAEAPAPEPAAPPSVPAPAREISLIRMEVGAGIENERIVRPYRGGTIRGYPAPIALRWQYDNGPVDANFTCSFAPEDGSPATEQVFRVNYVSGTAWCFGNLPREGSYRVTVSAGDKAFWSQLITVEPDAVQRREAERLAAKQAEETARRERAASATPAVAQPSPDTPPKFEPQPVRSGFAGTWTGVGRDNGVDWRIVLTINSNPTVGSVAGTSTYVASDRCFGQFTLIEQTEGRIVLEEKKVDRNNVVNLSCKAFSPAGKQIVIEANAAGFVGTWRKKNRSARVTMTAALTRID